MVLSMDTGINNFGLVVLDMEDNLKHIHVVQTSKSKDKKMRVSTDYTNRIRSILGYIRLLIETYPIKIITAEMPSFGAKDSNAAVSLTAGATIAIATSTLFNIPAVYASPEQIKLSFAKDRKASKRKMMRKCCKLYNWPITYKEIKAKETREVIRVDAKYHVGDKILPSKYFEHIADAIAAYHTCKKLKEFKRLNEKSI